MCVKTNEIYRTEAYVELQNPMKKRILYRVLRIWPLMLRGESRQVLLLL